MNKNNSQKLKILFLTSLYPDQDPVTIERQTKALHQFIKYWVKQSNIEVKVIKLHFYPIDEKKYEKKKSYVRDGVTIDSLFMLDKSVAGEISKKWIFFWMTFGRKLGIFDFDQHNTNTLIEYLELERFNPDIILSHSMLTFKVADLLSEKLQIPYILGFHRSDIDNLVNSLKWRDYIFKHSKNAVALISRSPSIKRILDNNLSFQKPFFTAISGINPKMIMSYEKAKEKHKSWKTGERHLRIISACTLIKLKNIDVILKALSKLPDHISYQYTVIGDGEERSNLEKLSHELKIKEKVTFLGKLSHSETLKMMENADLFIMVSAPETFGLAYLEAMAKGNIVIGAKENGIDGVVKDKKEAFLCQPGKLDELKMILIHIAQVLSQKEILQVVENSLNRIHELNEEKVAVDYLSFIENVYQYSNGK